MLIESLILSDILVSETNGIWIYMESLLVAWQPSNVKKIGAFNLLKLFKLVSCALKSAVPSKLTAFQLTGRFDQLAVCPSLG